MNWSIAQLLLIMANLFPGPAPAEREALRKKEAALMQTKPDKMDELFRRYETVDERFTNADGEIDHEGEMKEREELENAIKQLCHEDGRNVERLLNRIDVLLTSMSRAEPEEYLGQSSLALDYIRMLQSLRVEAVEPYHQRIKDLMFKAFEAMKNPRENPYSVCYPHRLLNIVAFLEFRQKKSPDVFRQYGKLAIEAMVKRRIGPLGDCEKPQPEEDQQYMRAAMDYVFDCMSESPEEECWELAMVFRQNVLESEGFMELDYFEQKLTHPSPIARFVAALMILLKNDPQHQKARQTLLETLEENVKSGAAQEMPSGSRQHDLASRRYRRGGAAYVIFLAQTRHYKYRSDEFSIEDLFSGGRYFAPFWSRMPLTDARRMLALLKKFVKDNYRADLRNPFKRSSTVTDHGVWLIGGLVMHHRQLIPDCQDLVPILLEILEQGYKLKKDPPYASLLFFSSCFALQAMGGDAAKKAVDLILTRLLKDENRFDIDLIGELGDFGPAAKEAVPVLRKLFYEATDPDVKAWILDSIKHITGSYD